MRVHPRRWFAGVPQPEVASLSVDGQTSKLRVRCLTGSRRSIRARSLAAEYSRYTTSVVLHGRRIGAETQTANVSAEDCARIRALSICT